MSSAGTGTQFTVTEFLNYTKNQINKEETQQVRIIFVAYHNHGGNGAGIHTICRADRVLVAPRARDR